MAFKMRGFSPFPRKEDKVQYAGGDVINTKEYKQALKDGVKGESEFAEYKRMGRKAWLEKYTNKPAGRISDMDETVSKEK